LTKLGPSIFEPGLVVVQPSTDGSFKGAYFDPDHNRLVVGTDYATFGHDGIYDAYAGHVLGCREEEAIITAGGSPDWACAGLGRGLAIYLRDSLKNDSSLSPIMRFNDGAPMRFIDGAPIAAHPQGRQIWLATLWRLRGLLWSGDADRLLFNAWFQFRSSQALDLKRGYPNRVGPTVDTTYPQHFVNTVLDVHA
jgi:hypothetical protein